MVLLLFSLIAIAIFVGMRALFNFSAGKPISLTNKPNKQPSGSHKYPKPRSATVSKAAPGKTSNNSPASPSGISVAHHRAAYVPFSEASASGAVVVDCTHPDAPTFTHHKSARNPVGLEPGNTSTDLVLNALAAKSQSFPGWLDKHAVTVNHFDGDALFSVWSFINRNEAMKYEKVLRCAAALHDFREIDFENENHALFHQALALCCWINTIERAQFTPPFEESDADEKFFFFLAELGKFLENPEAYKNIWQQEYTQVVEDYKLIKEQGLVKKYSEIGVAVVRCPRPVHYYALFSHTIGCDVVVSEYIDDSVSNGWKYEVEEKYTQFVNVWSRLVTARLDMTPLASFLNKIDTNRASDCDWASPRIVDSGPLLRLDSQGGKKLLKSERYGHPTARPHHPSGLAPDKFEAIILSFFRFGLQGVKPKLGGFSWDELQQLNASKIDWNVWETTQLLNV
jgi:hypothetical protein